MILGRHVHLCAHDMLSLQMCGCDAALVVFEGSSDAKVANTAMTTSVQQHVHALDVTGNDTHLPSAGRPDPMQRRTAQESARWPSAAPGTAASAR